ncbi:MAG: penicillin-binding protein 1C [Lentimicrobium sp.]|nr:penicillin-binding protein 1C [Lentimicrobium sp.]
MEESKSSLNKDSKGIKIARILSKTRIVVFLLAILFPILLFLLFDWVFPLKPFNKDYSTTIAASDGQLLHAFLTNDDKWRLKADLTEITPDLKKTIVFKEDKYFYLHPGVNPLAIGRAMFNNLKKGRRTSGASTITMQLARLLEPAPRTPVVKIKEMFRSLQLEWHLSKDEILQLYFNLLPYGGNIEGVKSASHIYFDEEPEALSLAQVVMLTVIPNDPNQLRPGADNGKLIMWRNHWLNRMKEKNLFPGEMIDDALNEPFTSTRHQMPRKAPHYAYRFRNSVSGKELKSTLNPEFQHKVETLAASYIRRLRSFQIGNLAVLVVNNQTMEVEAYVGSAGFNEDAFQGQVDGITALRSPGSTLKPLLYALAIDDGLITPKTLVTDVPQNFAGYRPENYDETYRGKVSIEQALALSLNVPAVELLDRFGTDRFKNSMSNVGFKWVSANKKKLGLSIILGGCGTTLEELTALYAAFANEGLFKPLKYTKNGDVSVADTLCSPGAAFMITGILTQLRRPDLPNQYQKAANLPEIAWKTGTSYGKRDGWAIGYNRNYTIGIWTGNFPGNGVPELNGAEFAVPLLFNIFNSLQPGQQTNWFAPPADLVYRLVCSETGLPPDTFCHNIIMDYALPGISPSMRCNHMENQFVNESQTLSYCRTCLPKKGYREVLYPHLTPQLIAWYNEMQVPYKAVPRHNPECPSVKTSNAPLITSLTDGAEYLLFRNRKQQLMLACNAENGVSKVYWYLNDKFYKSGKPDEKVFFNPNSGNYKISCSDDRGRNSNIWIRVSFI